MLNFDLSKILYLEDKFTLKTPTLIYPQDHSPHDPFQLVLPNSPIETGLQKDATAFVIVTTII